MKKSTKYIATIAIVAAVVGFTAFKLLRNQNEVRAEVYQKVVNLKAVIKAYTVKEEAFTESTPFIGSFAPNREITITSESAGKVVKVGVNEGDAVRAGALIAQLDVELLQAQLLSAQASLDNAEKTLKRFIRAQSGVTHLQLDNAQTQCLMAKAQTILLKKQISQATITAPFAGVITSRKFDLGVIAAPGVPMASLIDISKLKLEISVPEKMVTEIIKGSQIDVKSDVYPNTVFVGEVDYVSSQADMSRNYTVKILVNNNAESPLKAGMYGRIVQIRTSQSKGISVPRSAIIGSTVKPQVYVIENGVAHLRDVQIGLGNESSITITNGLKSNEMIATSGLVNLIDGCEVSIAN